ncbi:MAG: flagellar protein FlgN [Firmicutes bacterium]|nr:flagellar protein FlgN [Bacillota bacterium]
MEKQLYGYLKLEQQLLEEMLRLADKQQLALINYRISELTEITSFQNALIINIRNAEEKRIALLMQWLDITRREAMELKLSTLEEKIEDEDVCTEIKKMRKDLRQMIDKLQNMNAVNRLLSNRARTNIKEMMDFITGGKELVNQKL